MHDNFLLIRSLRLGNTIFFANVHSRGGDKIQVLSECKRVLKNNGRLFIKDSKTDCDKDIFIFNTTFKLPGGKLIQTGYGVYGVQKQTVDWLEKALKQLGLNIVEESFAEYWFNIKCKR